MRSTIMLRVRGGKKLHQVALIVLSAAILAAIVRLTLTVTSDMRPRDMTADSVFEIRKRRIEQVCASSNISGRVNGVFTHNSGVMYCLVPKAGCTFWKSVFFAANTKNSVTKSDVFSLAKNYIHEVLGTGSSFADSIAQRAYPTRLLVVRDPYSRLLSSYLDKFYLPDFWPTEALRLTRIKNMLYQYYSGFNATGETDFLRHHFDRMNELFASDNVSGNTTVRRNGTACGKYTTFKEFIQYGFYLPEPHWMPIHSICNPCLLNVTHISLMETFTSDARAVLEKMGIGHLLDDVDKVNQIDEEIKTTIRYSFYLIEHSKKAAFYQNCLTPQELGYRLWHNLRWRGYIDPGVEYVIPDFTEPKHVEADLFQQLRRARKSGLEKPVILQKAKEAFKMAAYKSLSKSLFLVMSRKYQMDFRLFGYEHIGQKLFSALYNSHSKAFKTW